jgi:heptosyltransferase II
MRRCLAPPARVVVRLPSWLGDLVMCEPVVRALHAHHARLGNAERLTLVAPRRLLSVFDGRFAGARRIASERGGREDVEAWRGHDAALLLNGSWNSAFTAFRAGIPERIGIARGGRDWLLTTGIVPALERGGVPLGLGVRGRHPRAIPRPFGSVCVELAALCGIEVCDRTPKLVAAPEAILEARARLARHGVDLARGFVLAHAGSRADSAKAFPAAQWRAVFEACARESDLALVVVCAPGEEANAREAARGIEHAVLFDDPAPELREVIALTALSRLVLTADSGPRHLARALGIPCVVACGPTDPRHTSDHDALTRVVRVDVPCGPCHREVCPLHGPERHACMTNIDAARIARIGLDLLNEPRELTPSDVVSSG